MGEPAEGDSRPPNVEAMDHWDAVVSDLEATAADYRDRGWDAVELHPGDVTVLTGDRSGLDVLVPDDEYRTLVNTLRGGVDVENYRAFKTRTGGMVYLVVAAEDPTSEVAICYPAYYTVEDAQKLVEIGRADGRVRTYLRRLQGEYVELAHEDPSLFGPP